MTYPPPPPPPPGPPPPPPGYGPPPGGAPAQPPDNNLVWGILVTVLCCLPFGIVSIIQATRCPAYGDRDNTRKRRRRLTTAKKWAIWGAIAGVIVAIIYILIAVVGGGLSYMNM